MSLRPEDISWLPSKYRNLAEALVTLPAEFLDGTPGETPHRAILTLMHDLAILRVAALATVRNIEAAEPNLFRLGALSATGLEHSMMLLRETLADIEKHEQAPVRTCRACGCTQEKACIDPTTGIACRWIEPDLCSACATHRGSKPA